jgi:DNA-binding beta-propeller fold protein YncE
MWLLGGLVSVVACNSMDAPAVDEGVRVVVPVDRRPAVQALQAPPISGGTLAVTRDGTTAIVADPDRDRVSLVDLRDDSVRHIALEPGAEPGRVIADETGRAYVALRRSGDVISVRLDSGALE